jgi:hypothetical protein
MSPHGEIAYPRDRKLKTWTPRLSTGACLRRVTKSSPFGWNLTGILKLKEHLTYGDARGGKADSP